jgi:HSP20 family molecular chaperone IbpA
LEALVSTKVVFTQVESIEGELENVRQEIGRRAFELYRSRITPENGPEENWRHAEREVIWEPPVEVRQTENGFEVVAALPGVDEVTIQVAPEALVIKSEGTHPACAGEGVVRLCDFSKGRLFRWIRFGERIDARSTTAECRNGLLRLSVSLLRDDVIEADAKPVVTSKPKARKRVAVVEAPKASRRTKKGNG